MLDFVHLSIPYQGPGFDERRNHHAKVRDRPGNPLVRQLDADLRFGNVVGAFDDEKVNVAGLPGTRPGYRDDRFARP
jgi:hypothetical protein